MTQGYDSHGRWVPITVVKTPNNTVYQLKNKEKDGYASAQIGFGSKKNSSKPLLGLAKKANSNAPVVLREVNFSGDVEIGNEISVKDVFRVGELIDITGTSKGKGFAGGMKRHGFHGGPRTHGQSDRSRAPGSIGSGTTPGRVYKGKKMAGHMGHEQVTVKDLEVLAVDEENNLLLVKGAIPGPKEGFVLVTKTGKKTKAFVEPEIPQIPNLGGDEPKAGEETTSPEASEVASEAVNEVKTEEDSNG